MSCHCGCSLDVNATRHGNCSRRPRKFWRQRSLHVSWQVAQCMAWRWFQAAQLAWTWMLPSFRQIKLFDKVAGHLQSQSFANPAVALKRLALHGAFSGWKAERPFFLVVAVEDAGNSTLWAFQPGHDADKHPRWKQSLGHSWASLTIFLDARLCGQKLWCMESSFLCMEICISPWTGHLPWVKIQCCLLCSLLSSFTCCYENGTLPLAAVADPGGPWGPGSPLLPRFLQNHAVFRQF